MSDQIKHECGLAVVRLLKPLDYYQKKYGSALYGLNKLQLLMQKMRNRGQDGAGIATINLNPSQGQRYISRKRSTSPQYLKDLFEHVYGYFDELEASKLRDVSWLRKNRPFVGELMMGHLRYGTHGINNIESCHPFLRQSNWISRNLVVAGNFNLTNVNQLFSELVQLGQFPKEKSDTVTVLEKIGHFLDDEVERIHTWYKPDGYSNQQITEFIAKELDVQRLLKRASKRFDGGYVMGGLIGHGDAFIMRDPNGIRPAYYFADDEVAVCASERPAIQTAFDLHFNEIKELKPAHALIIKKDGRVTEEQFIAAGEKKACSFERIYFSRGTDRDIYTERKQLGAQLAKPVLKEVDYKIKKTVFSYIPNTAETAYYGMVEGIEDVMQERHHKYILDLCKNNQLTKSALRKELEIRPRLEKLVVKDAKLRTFIADDNARGDLVSHVYDITYGIVRNDKDTLVLMDDSIVRGTTLKDSIISILARLKPKKIIIVSSAPQIRYPDCYGIDMSKMGEFVAFRALIKLLERDDQLHLLDETYTLAKKQLKAPDSEVINAVKPLYALYKTKELSAMIAKLVTPTHVSIPVKVVYQSIHGLHEAVPGHTGDWYFTGDYPTPGGMRTVNRAFINYIEKNNKRSYEE